jgi:hypothetical protein
MKKDIIKNYYNIIDDKYKNETKLDKNYNKHYIKPCSMICEIAGTGGGKSNALISFLSRKTDAFYEIICFTSNPNEPLFKMMKDKIPQLEIYDDIDKIKPLNEYDDNYEKLIIFDDFINLPKKQMKKIEDYMIAARKKKFTVVLNAQSYKDIPTLIRSQINYWWIFKLSINADINKILKNHNVFGIDEDTLKNMYYDATEQPFQFMILDTTARSENEKKLRYRSNFLNFY